MEKQTKKKQSKTKQNNKEKTNKQKHFKQQEKPLPQNCRKIQKQNNELKT